MIQKLEAEPSPAELADPPDPPPQISVATTLRGAHPASLALHAVLEKLEPDRDGILYLRAISESCIRVSPGFRRRVVLILDALAKGLEARGALVTFRTPADARRWGAYEIRVDAEEQHVSLRFFEPFHQVRVKPTPEQLAQEKKYGWHLGPKHKLVPSGKLTVRVHEGYPEPHWGDREGHPLEEQLGEVIVGIERVFVRARRRDEERAMEEERQRHAQRQRDAREAARHYQEALGMDLERMAGEWQRARLVRDFVRNIEMRVPKELRSSGFAAWLEWARTVGERMDPISDPSRLSKILAPDFSTMPEAHFRRWVQWDPGGGYRPLPEGRDDANENDRAYDDEDSQDDDAV